MKMTPKKLDTSRKRLRLTHNAMAKTLGISERFWLYRVSGALKIPNWLEYAMLWLLHQDKIKR